VSHRSAILIFESPNGVRLHLSPAEQTGTTVSHMNAPEVLIARSVREKNGVSNTEACCDEADDDKVGDM
jgi:hypothetical protein